MAFDVSSVGISGQAGAGPESFSAADGGADIMALLQAMIDADAASGPPAHDGGGPSSSAAASQADPNPSRLTRFPLASGLDFRALRAAMRNAAIARSNEGIPPSSAREDLPLDLAVAVEDVEAASGEVPAYGQTADEVPIVGTEPAKRHPHEAEEALNEELLIALAIQSPPSAEIAAPPIGDESAPAAIDVAGNGTTLEPRTALDPAATSPEFAADLPATDATPAPTDIAANPSPGVSLQLPLDPESADVTPAGSKRELSNVSQPQATGASGESGSMLSAGARALFQRLREQGVLSIDAIAEDGLAATNQHADAGASLTGDAVATATLADANTAVQMTDAPAMSAEPPAIGPQGDDASTAAPAAGTATATPALAVTAAASLLVSETNEPGEPQDAEPLAIDRRDASADSPASVRAAADRSSGSQHAVRSTLEPIDPSRELASHAPADGRLRSNAAATASFAALFIEPMRPVAGPTALTDHQQRDSNEDADSGLIYSHRRELLSPAHAAHALQVFAAVEQTAAVEQVADSVAEAPRSHPLPNEQAVAATLVQSMRVQYRDGVGTAVVQLDPEYLGKVTIVLEMGSGGSVTARMHAASNDVRTWLQANETILRQGLAEKGLSLDRLVVSDGEHQEEALSRDPEQHESAREQQRQRRKPGRRADAATFAVVV